LEGSKGVDLVQDFHMRVQHYKKVVQPIHILCVFICSLFMYM